MQPLLALLDRVVACIGDDALIAHIHVRAAELRRSHGIAAGSVVRVEAAVGAIAETLELSLPDAWRLAGERAMSSLVEQLAPVLRVHSTAHTLCLDLNTIVHTELQPLAPMVTMPVIDVLLIDFTTLRLSLVASDNMVALLRGLLVGLATHYGQVARFSVVSEAQTSSAARLAGRQWMDVAFVADTRSEAAPLVTREPERRLSSVAVALQSLFR